MVDVQPSCTQVLRAHLDTIADPENGEKGDVTVMRLLVTAKDGSDGTSINWKDLIRDAR